MAREKPCSLVDHGTRNDATGRHQFCGGGISLTKVKHPLYPVNASTVSRIPSAGTTLAERIWCGREPITVSMYGGE